MNENYQGMRWLKCDLQVQTPEDSAHWTDEDLRLENPRRKKLKEKVTDETGQDIERTKFCEKDIQEKAKTFLKRCHELKLDVVGITDHNFSQKKDARDWFLTHLVEQNNGVAKEAGRSPLV